MTLLEALVWIAVFTFAMLAVSSSLIMFYRTNSYAIQEASAVSSAQLGVDSMINTIREASYSAVGAYPVLSMATSSFTFYANVDADPLAEEVQYYVSGNGLYLSIIQPTGDPSVYTGAPSVSLVSDNVQNIGQNVNLFTYYDQNGAQITDVTEIGNVRFVTVNLVTNLDPNRAPSYTTLQSSATLRNLVD